MKLSVLRDALTQARPVCYADVDILGVTDDSRQVEPGWLFVAVPGHDHDGHKYVGDAVLRGAAAVVAERECAAAANTPQLLVPDSRAAAADLAAAFYGHPSRRLQVVAVTGTDGKSSTALIAANIAKAAGRTAGVIGTIAYVVGDRTLPSEQTTPGPIRLQQLLAQMRDAGVDAAFIEASSHGLAQGRLRGVRVAAAVHTVVSRDHLDYHRTEQAYYEAKSLLFKHADPSGVAVLNADDPVHELFQSVTPARVVRYSLLGRQADYAAEVLEEGLDGCRFILKTPEGSTEVRSQLIGRHNVQNCLAAAACLHSLGADLDAVRRGIESMPPAPGRLERVNRPGEPAVLVDYAHTPHALASVLRALRPLAPARIIVVFGCGGDRDKGKRPQMGKVVSEAADLAWVTSDNPRSEDPLAIINDILAGVERRGRCRVEPDRRRAIEAAVAEARPEDIVLVAGKGHEAQQIFKDHTIPFSDADAAREALDKRLSAARRA